MTRTKFTSKILFLMLLFLSGIKINYAQSIEEQLKTIEKSIELNEFEAALERIEKLEDNAIFIKVDRNKLNLDLKKARIYIGQKEQDKAMNILLTNLNKFDDNKDEEYYPKFVNYLGNIFAENKNYVRARYYYYLGLEHNLAKEDSIGIPESYSFLGRTYMIQEYNDSAVSNFKKVISFPISTKNENLISNAFLSLSGLAVLKDDFDLAKEYGEQSLNIEKSQKDTLGQAKALFNLSGIYYRKNEFEKAKLSYSELYESVKNIHTPDVMSIKENALYNLSYVNEELKDFEKAYFYLLEATELTDSLSEANRIRNISEIEAKYNVEKVAKEAEEEKSIRQRTQFYFYASIFAFISVLVLSYIFYRNYRLKREMEVDKLTNDSQIKIINATIDAKEQERKSIAEILHDSVSALLSSANLHLQATKAQLKTGYPQEITKAQTIVNEASVKIRDLSHELISSVLLKFGLAFAVHDMCQKYSNSEISLFSDDDGVKRYEQNFEIKIHSIIEELVNNILKHSKAKNATIVLAHRENNMLSIRMNDDGVGFDAKNAKTKGGLGLSHIDARITVMKGVFNIVSSKENGTSIFILVPIVPIS